MKHPTSFDTDEVTSRRMAKVKLKRGIAETIIAKSLWQKGFRYRLNYKKLPGSPDIAILKYRVAIVIDGEFWHGYDWENKKCKLNRNKEYWIEKIEENIARDKRNNDELLKLGWYVIRLWEKQVIHKPQKCIGMIEDTVNMLK